MVRRPPGPGRQPGARIRALKVGVTSGKDFVHQVWFTAPSMVSAGRNPDATIVLDHPDVPEQLELVSVEEESCLLQFNRRIELAFFYDGLFRRPNYLIDEGLAFRRGRNYYLNLKNKARGTLSFGPYRLLFKVDEIDAGRIRKIALPSAAHPVPHCGACGQPLEMALARRDAVARCDVCRRYSRFTEGLAREPVTASRRKPTRETPPPSRRLDPDEDPILLDKPVLGPGGLSPSALEDQSTVLDAGVIQQMEGSFGDLALPMEASGPVFPGAPDDFEEKDTGEFRRNQLVRPPADPDELLAAAGDPVHVSGEHRRPQPALSSMPVDVASGNVVPMPMSPSARRRVSAALSSAPHPAVRETRDTARITDTYAAARLADRLTLLIFALILIALLLACILGVLLVQGPLRSLGSQLTAPTATGALQLDDPSGEGG